jgi:predicted kinase
MNQQVLEAIQVGADVVWDQTNISVKSRAPKLAVFPKEYKKVAVVFPTPGAVELGRRLASRAGKNIPDYVMRSMIANLQPPSAREGFDKIITA